MLSLANIIDNNNNDDDNSILSYDLQWIVASTQVDRYSARSRYTLAPGTPMAKPSAVVALCAMLLVAAVLLGVQLKRGYYYYYYYY